MLLEWRPLRELALEMLPLIRAMLCSVKSVLHLATLVRVEDGSLCLLENVPNGNKLATSLGKCRN